MEPPHLDKVGLCACFGVEKLDAFNLKIYPRVSHAGGEVVQHYVQLNAGGTSGNSFAAQVPR